MDKVNWIDAYLKSHFYGFALTNQDKGCHLYFKDINNFIQNVGRFTDVVVVRYDGEILLNTRGVYIDRIWPELSWNDRTSQDIMDSINYVAMKLWELRAKEGLDIAPLPKINKFMKEVLGQEAADRNMEIIRSLQEDMKEGVMEMKAT
ncbi:hypothetical protein MKA58_11800 [[Clostridium] innocuum]|nr:hypothetical protein [[Clostridium] innocuum]